ncbi:MAG: UDP-N-acetylmuramoyl-tripeptide--D-alanyl-D-alanine ligase [Devosia sp.]
MNELASPLWTVAEIVAATNGFADGVTAEGVTAVSIDSRDIQPGALFVAIKGDTHDGHDFVGAALDAGAAAALVSADRAPALGRKGVIGVRDPMKALEALARAARERSTGRIIAITGSVGKTSTKEAVRTVLSASGKVHASIKSYNNHWGVPLMLANLPRNVPFGVFEIGMNHAGEIANLVKMVRPHIALVTSVAPAHLEFFPSVTAIAEAKAEILLGLEPGGTAVFNADHDYLHVLMGAARRLGITNIVTYGFDESSDWQIGAPRVSDAVTHATISHEGQVQRLALRVPGRHMIANATAAIVVNALVGGGAMSAIGALGQFAAPEGRGETLRLGNPKKPLLLVDESYNANTASMRAAMEFYSGITPPSGRKVLVLGDMLELGPESPNLHRSLADAVKATGATQIYLIGKDMAALRDALGDGQVTAHAESVEQLAETILGGLAPGDSVMVKGSKGVRLAGLVRRIRETFA